MAKRATAAVNIPLGAGPNGAKALHDFLKQYRAHLYKDSSTEKGHVYWSAPIAQWMLVMRKGDNAIVTFHAADDCPCKKL